jgi:hypothetical protein
LVSAVLYAVRICIHWVGLGDIALENMVLGDMALGDMQRLVNANARNKRVRIQFLMIKG